MYLIPLPPYLRSTFSSVSFSHLWFTSFISFSIWRLCCLSSIWKLLSWRFDSFWEQKSLIKSHFLHSVRHCEQLFWPFSSHFVMHSVQVNLWQKLLFLHQLHNPQYDDRLFIELQLQYMKIPSSEHILPMFCKKKSFWQRFTCKGRFYWVDFTG